MSYLLKFSIIKGDLVLVFVGFSLMDFFLIYREEGEVGDILDVERSWEEIGYLFKGFEESLLVAVG